VQSSRDFDQA
jgi:hypothetical protein